MQKGKPSVNPAGRGAPVAKAKRAVGHDGVIAHGGRISTGERNAKLVGSEKWLTYRNSYQHPAVAISLLLRNALFAGVRWSLEENSMGGAPAARGLEVVEQGLLDARLAKPWKRIAAKAGMFWANGVSVHAAALGRRPDGVVTYTDIGHRPPHTFDTWHRKDPQSPWESIGQRISTGETYTLPLSECLYVVNDAVSDSPEGEGVLRFVVERLRRITQYETMEGSEIFSSMGGTPIARVPWEEINSKLGENLTEDQIAAERTRATSNITTIVSDRIKTPEKRQYAVLDSATYEGTDPNNITSIKKWDIEIIKGELQGLPEIRKVINDLHLDVARILGVEWVFMGSEGGAYAMHADKTSMFAATLSGDLAAIASAANQQLVRRLVAANGLDPDLAAPTLVPSPIGSKDVEKVARSLGLIQMAGLPPNHPAKVALFEMLELPWQDEDSIEQDMMLPRGNGKPPPDEEEEDVEERDEDEREDVKE